MRAWRPASTSSTDPPLLEVGRVVKPHGLKGEVIVKLVTDRVERLEPGTVLTTDAGPLEVLWSSPHQGRHIVAFAGVTDHAAADALRETVLTAPPLDDPGALWVHDLVGSSVVGVDGQDHGRVVAVEANPASDLLVLEDGGLVPVRFVVSSEPSKLVVDVPAGLLD